MAGFRVLPIDSAITEKVRNTLKSPQYGHPAHVELAAGYGPCRSCLKQFRTGKKTGFCSLTTRSRIWTATLLLALSSFMQNHVQVIQNQINFLKN